MDTLGLRHAEVDVECRTDGTRILRSPVPLAPYARCVGEHLEGWAVRRPDAVFLAQRDGVRWRTLTWAQARHSVRRIATALLERNLSANRPVVILSENSIGHALLTLACMHAGIPAAPISPAYSLMSKDFGKLKAIFELLQPGLVFAEDRDRFENALAAVGNHRFEFVIADALHKLTDREDTERVERAYRAVEPATIAKFLFTSGSTGEPKGVINTQRMLCSNIQTRLQSWLFLQDEAEEPPVLCDWLPWNHTFGGNNNIGIVLGSGGAYYIDEGKPMPGLIEATVRNLREISPTIYLNAPRGIDMLMPYLENDAELRQTFFARLRVIMYGGAAMPSTLWERLQRLIDASGRQILLGSGWGSTETAPQATLVHFEPIRSSVIGLPTPGCEVKMVPTGEEHKYELRVGGPHVTPGYWKRSDLTAAAFDEDGYYKIGDTGCFADRNDPAKGIEFVGRLAEEFKLTSGTWVHVGALRVRTIAALSPIAQDVVVAGDGRDEIGILIFPSAAGCRSLSKQALVDRIREGMRDLRKDPGCSMCPVRAILLEEPPDIDAGEITDKGYINQRAVLARRAALVERLYADPAPPEVILCA